MQYKRDSEKKNLTESPIICVICYHLLQRSHLLNCLITISFICHTAFAISLISYLITPNENVVQTMYLKTYVVHNGLELLK